MIGIFEPYVLKTLIPIAYMLAGILLGRVIQRLDDRSIAAVCLFVFAPALLFRHALGQIPFTHDFIFILFFVVFHTSALFLIAYKVFQFLDVSSRIHRLFLMNTIIISELALRQIQPLLGEPSQAAQIVNMIVFYYMLVFATLGLYLVEDERGTQEGIGSILKLPLIYALAAGLILAISKVEMPYLFLEAIDPLYKVALPLALVLAGILFGKYVFFVQIHEYRVLLPGLIAVVLFRMVLSPALAMLIAPLVTMENVELQRALILSSGAPTGLLALLIVSYYGRQNEKRFVVLCVLLTTIIHFGTLPLLYFLVNHWFPLTG